MITDPPRPDRPFDTATVSRRKSVVKKYSKDYNGTWRPYLFALTEPDLHRLNAARVSTSAVLAFAVIRSAERAAVGSEWVTIRKRARDAVGRDYRWWHSATRQLEAAKLIECQRQRGRLPRYRIICERAP